MFDRGGFTENGNVFVNFGYAFTDSNNFRNNNSSTATSSFDESAASDRQNPANSTSNYETRHAFTFAANFTEEFTDGYDTRFGVFFSARSGRPFSLAFDGGGMIILSGDRHSGALYHGDPEAFGEAVWEITSSPLNFSFAEGDTGEREPDPLRRSGFISDENFGMVEIDWAAGPVRLNLNAADGSALHSETIPFR